jgi:hypothetical protein
MKASWRMTPKLGPGEEQERAYAQHAPGSRDDHKECNESQDKVALFHGYAPEARAET